VSRNLDSNSVRTHIQLEQAIYGNESEAYASRATKVVEEAEELVETEFEHVFDIDGVKMFRKRK